MFFVALAYVLVKGLPVGSIIVKFFLIDMIYLSAFVAIGGGFGKIERCFSRNFASFLRS